MRKKSILAFYVVFFSILLLTSVQANIKTNKDNYNTGDTVYVLSTVGISDFLCRSQNPEQNVVLYVVEHKDQWNDGDSFEEVRDETTLVPNSKFPNKNIWEDPKAGNYDLIIDCNKDQKYDETSEPLYNKGFTISAKKGAGEIVLKETINLSWQYDPENPELIIKILQLELSVKEEDIKLENITIEFDSPENVNLEIYVDKNNDGKLNPVDLLIGLLESSEEVETFNLDYTLSQGAKENILFVYNLKEEMTKGKYNLKVTSLNGIGVSSNKLIKFSNVPIQSSTLTVLDTKTCLGTLNLILDPNPAFSDSTVVARIINLTGCHNKTVSLRSNDCYQPLKKEIDSCVFENNNCEIIINAIKGEYHACIDKNGDGDETDFGESDTKYLMIKVKEIPPTEEIGENTSTNIIGKVIDTKEISQSLSNFKSFQNNPILVLLEITLLLILFVLILIFFQLMENTKLRAKESTTFFEETEENKKEEGKKEEEEEEKEKKEETENEK